MQKSSMVPPDAVISVFSARWQASPGRCLAGGEQRVCLAGNDHRPQRVEQTLADGGVGLLDGRQGIADNAQPADICGVISHSWEVDLRERGPAVWAAACCRLLPSILCMAMASSADLASPRATHAWTHLQALSGRQQGERGAVGPR